MCGIAGIVRSRPGPDVGRIAAGMADALSSRGPDGEGLWVDALGAVALSHRRLAVIDTAPTGSQPMASADGRWVVVFNGEIYDHRSLRTRLGDRPYRGHGDTATLVEAIAVWGVEATLLQTNGMFALAAWDTVDRRLVLARDRLGEKPLYWSRTGDQVAFASQIGALRGVPGHADEIDPLAVAALLRRSFVPHPWTIRRGVRQVPPGGLVEVDLSADGMGVTERAWWSLSDAVATARADRLDVSTEEATDLVDEAVARAVALRLESDVPLGAFLSGGIDSSLVASHAHRALGGRLRTLTVAMPDVGFDESEHARRVAAHLGTDHTEIALRAEDAIAAIASLPRVYDEPFADPSMLPTVLLCEVARRHLTVVLSGDGGDELFAGYNRHVAGARWAARLGRVPRPVRRVVGRGLGAVPPSVVDGAARLLPGRVRPPLLADKVHKLGDLAGADGDPWDVLSGVWPADALGPAHDVAGRSTIGAGPETMLLTDTAAVLPDQMLVKVDRAGMAVGLEVRVPLLDPELLTLAWRLPLHHKVEGGVGKVVLRRVATRHLPADLATRPKMGFDPPLGRWLREDLRPWASDVLARPQCVEQGWLDEATLRRTWDEHQRGTRDRSARLWAVLMLEAWLADATAR